MSSEDISNLYLLCGKENETIDHLFVHCELSLSLWCQMISWSCVQWCLLEAAQGMIKEWTSSFSMCDMVLWRLDPFAIMWSMWKERNVRVLRGSLLPTEVLSLVYVHTSKWAFIRGSSATWSMGFFRTRKPRFIAGRLRRVWRYRGSLHCGMA